MSHISKFSLSQLLCGTTAVALIAAAPAVAVAQQAEPVAASGQVEEVVVTAQRREQRLQDVPIAVTAVTATRLAQQGIKGTEELSQVTPGLQMSRLRQSATPFMRGVGSLTSTAGFEAPNSTYIDGIYVPSMPGGFFSFNNIARVEVLKGPQGTLFGRNAVGGLIQVITKDPSQTPSADVSATYGDYETVEGNFYGTTGLTDNLAADLSLYVRRQGEGYGNNVITGADVNFTNEFSARTKFLLSLDGTTITTSVDYSKQNGAVGLSRNPLPGRALVGGYRRVPGWQNVALDQNPYNRVEQWGASVKVDQDLGFARFVSLSGARRSLIDYTIDEGTPINRATQVISEYNDAYSQEFQLQSQADSAVEWVGGVYAYLGQGAFNPLRAFGSTIVPGPQVRLATVHSRSLAAFGQATFNIADATRLTVGGRYTQDRKSLHATNYGPTGLVILTVPPTSKTWGKPTWRVALDHKLTEDVLIYATYSRGFKGGAYSASSPLDLPVRPETLDAFEIGQKGEFFDHRLRLNASAYYYNYKDIQLSASQGSPPTQHLFNAANGKIKGVDLDAEWVPTRNLSLRAAASLIDAKYKDFPGGPIFTPNPLTTPTSGGNTAGFADLSGNKIVRTPAETYSLSGAYTIPLSAGDISLAAQVAYNGGFRWQVDNRLRQPAYTVVNGSIAFKPANSSAEIRVWAKNLTNEHYWIDAVEDTTGDTVVAAPPRTVGVTVAYRFQ